jgi:hypothetical protein
MEAAQREKEKSLIRTRLQVAAATLNLKNYA